MIRLAYPALFCLTLAACQEKKKNAATSEEPFFDVVGFLKSQVAGVDTSLYRIIKVETRNGVSDTVFLPREEFRKYAAEFTSLPNIGSEELRGEYQASKMVDTLLESVVLSYTAIDPETEIRREDLTIDPRIGGDNSEVKTVFIHRLAEENGRTIDKKMLWEVDRRFLVMTQERDEAGKEKISKLEVKWQGHPPAN